MQRAGLIRYTRGRVTILNRRGLEKMACECYATVRREFDRLLATEYYRALGSEILEGGFKFLIIRPRA
ncbi:hypothetical protein BH20VER3_BH20VER3_13000 [soil metagenome]